MFEVLKEADDLLLLCTEEGLVYGTKAVIYRSTLDQLHVRAEGARFEAHAARTYAEDVANWFKGLSRTIRQICWKVRDVRAEISTTSLRERERQAALCNLAMSDSSTSEASLPGGAAIADHPESPLSSTPSLVNSDVPPHGLAYPSPEILTPSCHLPHISSPEIAPAIEKASCLSVTTPPTMVWLQKIGHSERRRSVSALSSGASSLQSMRKKKRRRGPARTKARFVRRARAAPSSPPVFFVDPHRLAAFELVDTDDDGGDDDSDWVDEQAVRIVA
ncbi:hypothetical protein OH76DRAFT_642313 [Lentinus brumalis]|uniref:Uncharacterized protein n=1 Tax=Lentinus brumalis TaxID=2498619 RepID=A0A371D7X0_9APHY|nr:hypothetical protein OH76DRAFT_642313 [Polyporus brumalis]